MLVQTFARRGRFWRAIFAAPAFLLLAGAKVAVTAPPQVLIGDAPPHALAAPFDAKPGDVLLTGKVFDIERIKIDAPIRASIDKFSQTIDAGTGLTTVMVGRDAEKRTGIVAPFYYCGIDQRTRSGFADAMIGDMFSKWETIVRFCFADVDRDQKLDHMILAGAKDKQLQRAVRIEPVAYRADRMVADEAGSEIRLVFSQLERRTGEVHLRLELRRNGATEGFTYLLAGSMRGEQFAAPGALYPNMKTDPAKRPYPVAFNDVLGAAVSVRSTDARSGTAQFVIARGFGPALFKPINVETRIIYVYI